jgi:signal transduction histidine kinase
MPFKTYAEGRPPGDALAHLLRAAGKELSGAQDSDGHSAIFCVTVEGLPKTLAPVLQDELYRMGRETRATLSPCARHAIEVEIRYDERMLRLRIRDDGIGIDAKVLERGARDGHWGLPGVRERGKLVGAQLDFWSEAGAGTEVQLTVHAAVAHGKSRESRAFGFFRSHAD